MEEVDDEELHFGRKQSSLGRSLKRWDSGSLTAAPVTVVGQTGRLAGTASSGSFAAASVTAVRQTGSVGPAAEPASSGNLAAVSVTAVMLMASLDLNRIQMQFSQSMRTSARMIVMIMMKRLSPLLLRDARLRSNRAQKR